MTTLTISSTIQQYAEKCIDDLDVGQLVQICTGLNEARLEELSASDALKEMRGSAYQNELKIPQGDVSEESLREYIRRWALLSADSQDTETLRAIAQGAIAERLEELPESAALKEMRYSAFAEELGLSDEAD